MIDYAHTLLVLGGVVLAILATAWLLRRVPGMGSAASADLRCKGALAVGGRERVLLVQCEGTRVLIGVAPGCVRRLAELPPATAEESYAGIAAKMVGEAG